MHNKCVIEGCTEKFNPPKEAAVCFEHYWLIPNDLAMDLEEHQQLGEESPEYKLTLEKTKKAIYIRERLHYFDSDSFFISKEKLKEPLKVSDDILMKWVNMTLLKKTFMRSSGPTGSCTVFNKETIKQVMLKLLATTKEQEQDPKYLKEAHENLQLIMEPIKKQYEKVM